MWQGQIEIEADPGAAADLFRVAGIEREVVRRVGMNRHREHLRALVEDALRAVAVMNVDVEDRDALARRRA
jgi:hypothetical protein